MRKSPALLDGQLGCCESLESKMAETGEKWNYLIGI